MSFPLFFLGVFVAMITVVANWFLSGLSTFSILLWFLAVFVYFIWTIVAVLWFCYLAPLMHAFTDYEIELMSVQIWKSLGEERDPELLTQARRKLRDRAGPVAQILNVDINDVKLDELASFFDAFIFDA